ncbi:hypothetical protein [Leclercia sp.]|uniref:hypothetical protein n=1 Tax=Leclercia sp. TaxID=1898428 RepID=UPI00289A98C3|nr:hypothetical protein [Leclercia sp.]
MIYNLHFDAEYVYSDELRDSNCELLTSMILNIWRDHCCFLIAEQEIDNYLEVIDTFPPQLGIKWRTALSTYKVFNIDNCYKPLREFPDLIAVANNYSKPMIDLIIVPNNYDRLGFTTALNYQAIDGLDIAKSHSIPSSNTYDKIYNTCNRDITGSETIDDIWDSKFSKLARTCSVITIIDRYLGLNIYQDSDTKKTSLEVFVDKILSHSNECSITIYTSHITNSSNGNSLPTDKNDCRTFFENFIRRKLSSKPKFNQIIINLEINICSESYFRTIAHDRFITFDKHTINLGVGMEIFRQNAVKATTCTLRYIGNTNFSPILNELIKNRILSVR